MSHRFYEPDPRAVLTLITAVMLLCLAQAHAIGLVSGHYVFRARYPGVCLDGTYPITLATGCELELHTDALGNLNGSVTVRSVPGTVTGSIRLRNDNVVTNAIEVDLQMPANNPSNKPADVFAFLHATQFLGTVENDDADSTFTLDVSAAEPLLVTFDLNLTVNAQGQVTGSGTASSCSVQVPVSVTGTNSTNCSLHIVGTNLSQFTWDASGPPTSFGFVATWSGNGFGFSPTGAQLPIFAPNAPALIPYVTSRKDHLLPILHVPAFAAYDINLPTNGSPGIECRSGGALGNHQIVVSFPANVSLNPAAGVPAVRVSSGVGRVSEFLVSDNEVTINLTGVADAQTITVTLSGVSDGINTANVTVPVSFLLGDTNGDTRVNVADTNQTKSATGAVTSSNFMLDLNLDGQVDASDIDAVKAQSGKAIIIASPTRPRIPVKPKVVRAPPRRK